MAGKKKVGIGLDIGSKAIRLVVLESNGRNIEIKTKISIPNIKGLVQNNEIGKKDELGKMLKELLVSNKVSDKDIVTALSPGVTNENNRKSYVVRTFLQQMLIPKELKRSIKFSIEKELPVKVEDYYTSYDIADRYNENGREVGLVFTVAVYKKLIDTFVEVLNSIKVSSYFVEMGMLANSRALVDPRNRHDIDNNVAIVDIGYSETGVLVISKGRPYYYRSIEIGTKDIVKNIAEKKGISESEAEDLFVYEGCVIDESDREFLQESDPNHLNLLITDSIQQITNEINEIINFAQRKGIVPTLQGIYLNGGGSKIKKFDQFLSNELGVQTRYLCPYFLQNENMPYDQEQVVDQLEYNTAIGLALKEVEK